MDVVLWWPRLWLVLPVTIQQQIEDFQALMLAFLNLATQTEMVFAICLGYLLNSHSISFLKAFTIFIFGIAITTAAYQSAVSQAKVYGTLIRSAVDVYRFDLLKSLHQSMPFNLTTEKKLWANLLNWVYFNQQDDAPLYTHDKGKP